MFPVISDWQLQREEVRTDRPLVGRSVRRLGRFLSYLDAASGTRRFSLLRMKFDVEKSPERGENFARKKTPVLRK